MSVDSSLLENIVQYSSDHSPKFTILVNDRFFPLMDVSIVNSSIPVNEPTTRGGVYFSEKFAYKMKGVINDLSVIPLLTKKMLCPNTEFGELKISSQTESDGKIVPIDIFTNLTNSVQTPNSIELSMIIVDLKLV